MLRVDCAPEGGTLMFNLAGLAGTRNPLKSAPKGLRAEHTPRAGSKLDSTP